MILIVRLAIQKPESVSNNDESPVEYQKEPLGVIIAELRDGNWKSCRATKTSRHGIGTVPKTICLDKTAQRIGASWPSWPEREGSLPLNHPWRDFFTKSRDSRIPTNIRDEYLQPASERLDDVKNELFQKTKTWLSAGNWKQLEKRFHPKCERYMWDARHHVWQALDADFEFKDQCGRCRCFEGSVSYMRTAVTQPVYSKGGRRTGPCAEACLYDEYRQRERESGKKERSCKRARV